MGTLALAPFFKGFMVGLSLIVAIGAQNAYVIEQGIKRQYIFMVALICSLIDASLILVGVAGLGALIESSPNFFMFIKYFGVLFLVAYGLLAFMRVFKDERLKLEEHTQKQSRKKIFLTLMAFSLLNPHVYLDTCILMGSIGGSFEGEFKWYFAAGGILGSFVWFFSLAYFSYKAANFLSKPLVWKVLNCLIASLMFYIAYTLFLM